jgi:NAD+ synthase (glutamine-hydrolysing)
MNSSEGARDRARSPNVIRLALAQVNPVVGDLPGNAKKVIETIEQARSQGAELVAFPELVLTGYPPEDLLLRPEFIDQNQAALEEVARATRGITAIVGFAQRAGDVYNAAAIAHDGRIAAVYQKNHLPNYGVFDEVRYFRPGRDSFLCLRGMLRFAVNICEDIWTPSGPSGLSIYAESDLVINLSASPFSAGKWKARDRMLGTRAADGVTYVAFVNTVGGQDELVFDGNSRVFGPKGEPIAAAASFEEELVLVDLDLDQSFGVRLKDPRSRAAAQAENGETVLRTVPLSDVPTPAKPAIPARTPRTLDGPAEVYEALVLGTRDYVRKNGFDRVVLGLSGGIDSALTASVAADALGPDRVTGAFLPSPFTSGESAADAEELATNLGVAFLTLPIGAEMDSYRTTLGPLFAGRAEDTTEENLQSRIRGNLLMALSNKFGWLVLTTGNKCEYSCGYATLYGDMAGGFAVL